MPESRGDIDAELAVAALVADRKLLGPCLLVWRRDLVIGLASTEALALAPTERTRVMTALDGSTTLSIEGGALTGFVGVSSFAVRRGPWPAGDVMPLSSGLAGSISGISDGRARAIAIAPVESGFRRVPIEIALESIRHVGRGGAGDDRWIHRAHAREAIDPAGLTDGAPIVVDHEASPGLGTPARRSVHAIACTRAVAGHLAPGRTAPFAELVELDLSRD